MGRWWICLAPALTLASTAAHAGEAYYFNKAGVTRETYVADVAECAELAGGVRVKSQYVYTPNLYAAAAAAFFSGLMESSERRQLKNAVERTCMADKGYRRLTIDKAAVKTIRGLDEKTRLDRMFDLAATDAPIGKELPE